MANLAQKLDACDFVSAVKVTERRRRTWLTGARPGDRWAVTLFEGGEFSYGPTFAEAFQKAWAPQPEVREAPEP